MLGAAVQRLVQFRGRLAAGQAAVAAFCFCRASRPDGAASDRLNQRDRGQVAGLAVDQGRDLSLTDRLSRSLNGVAGTGG